MQCHDAYSKGKEGQGLDPHHVWGVPLSAKCPPVGGCGSPPWWRRLPAKKERGCGGEEGHGVRAGRVGGLWGGWRARARGVGVAVCSAASVTVRLTGEEGRPGLAKVGRGARGGGAGGHGQRRGPHPARLGRIPPSIIHGGESWWRRGEAPRRPLAAEPDGTGPAGWIPGGRAGLGSGAPGPGTLVAVGRRGGDRAGLWAAAGEGGAWKGRTGSGANPKGPPGAGRGLGSRGRPFLEGAGGGVAPCPGDDGGPS